MASCACSGDPDEPDSFSVKAGVEVAPCTRTRSWGLWSSYLVILKIKGRQILENVEGLPDWYNPWVLFTEFFEEFR
jgi:hypothetical protein